MNIVFIAINGIGNIDKEYCTARRLWAEERPPAAAAAAALLPAVPHIWDDRGRYGRYFISSKDILDSGDQYILQY